MSQTLNVVLQRLRDFSNNKLAELDGLCDEHQRWLQSEVEYVKQQAAAQAPAAKRQKVQPVSLLLAQLAGLTCTNHGSHIYRSSAVPAGTSTG